MVHLSVVMWLPEGRYCSLSNANFGDWAPAMFAGVHFFIESSPLVWVDDKNSRKLKSRHLGIATLVLII